MLGGGDDVRLRGVHHHHPATCGCFHIDVVEADAGPANDDQLRACFQHLGGDLGGRADDQRMSADDVRVELGQIEVDDDLMAGGAEPIEAPVGDFLGHEYARHGPILIGNRRGRPMG